MYKNRKKRRDWLSIESHQTGNKGLSLEMIFCD